MNQDSSFNVPVFLGEFFLGICAVDIVFDPVLPDLPTPLFMIALLAGTAFYAKKLRHGQAGPLIHGLWGATIVVLVHRILVHWLA